MLVITKTDPTIKFVKIKNNIFWVSFASIYSVLFYYGFCCALAYCLWLTMRLMKYLTKH